MPRIETWACRTCGKLKAAGNSWWLISRIESQFTVRPMGDADRVMPDEDAVCGREHVQREVELYLAAMMESHREATPCQHGS